MTDDCTLFPTLVFTLGGSSEDQVRTDFKVMEAGMSLCIPPITRCRFDEQILHEAAMFNLSKDNVTPISWGTKQIKLSDAGTVTLPSLTRRNSPRHMYENYMALCSERGTNSAADDSHLSISWGKFYEILRQKTAGGEKMLSAVNYVTRVLVNDQVTLLQRIVDDIVDTEKKPVLTNYITIMRIFLKQQYDSHALTEGDEIGIHGIDYGICKPDLSIPAHAERCNGCNFVTFCKSELQESVAAADALEVINNAAKKLELYQGHRVLVTLQPTSTFGENYQRHGKKCLDKKRRLLLRIGR